MGENIEFKPHGGESNRKIDNKQAVDMAKKMSGVTAKFIALKVIIVLLAIAIGVLSIVFICKMIGGVLDNGCAQVVNTLENALNGDFDSYWSLLPEDYVTAQAAEKGRYGIQYKSDMKSAYKKYSGSLDKNKIRYELEASKQKKVSSVELKRINKKLIEEDRIIHKCTEAYSITLTVNKITGSKTKTTDHDEFLIGKIDGEWYALDFAFAEPKTETKASEK